MVHELAVANDAGTLFFNLFEINSWGGGEFKNNFGHLTASLSQTHEHLAKIWHHIDNFSFLLQWSTQS